MRSILAAALLIACATLAGCSDDAAEGDEPGPGREQETMAFGISDVGQQASEPSIGITSSGCAFYTAFEKVMRSCDLGASWEEVQDPVACQDGTSDPYLWVDPITDRIFNVQMVNLVTTWICWSDDDGATWLGNPADSGPIPVNDHIKVGSGPWTGQGYGTVGQANPAYASAVYFCYNKLVGIFCYTSLDGGASFTAGAQGVGLVTQEGGLHGAITTGPEGTVYVPPRLGTPTVAVSHDNGLTWTTASMGGDVGTPNPRKNSEVATDDNGTAYHVWIGGDQGVYMSRSFDQGRTWEQTSIRISPASVVSATFPHTDAGAEGRVAFAYLGSEDAHLLEADDIDGQPWDGNPHTAPDNTTYHLYLTYSLDATAARPNFTTVRLTDDPVQAGSICISSGDCRNIGGSNRNLLDFNDLTLGPDGRIWVAYADGCTDQDGCIDEPTAENSRDRHGMVAVQTDGPWLRPDAMQE